MRIDRKALIAGSLLAGCIGIHIYSADAYRVERYYSTGVFQYISSFFRSVFGWIPFSIGDFLYGFGVGWVAWKLGYWMFTLFRKRKPGGRKLMNRLYKGFVLLACIYIFFNLAWGINYNRKGIAWQLGLDMKKYQTSELREINCLIIDKLNASKQSLVRDRFTYPDNKELYKMVYRSYDMVAKKYPFLSYQPVSFKTSMWGWLGNYAAFTGYYNPFTGEAQLNTTVPRFLLPYTACHEVAHQLGYAKEMEANFVGYLAATASTDTLFHYSVYLDLFTYANRNLFFTDSVSAKLYRKDLDTAVVADLKEWAAFNKEHVSFIEPYIKWIYGKYLQGNQQPQGMLSYDEVTAFIIGYYKKFGKI